MPGCCVPCPGNTIAMLTAFAALRHLVSVPTRPRRAGLHNPQHLPTGNRLSGYQWVTPPDRRCRRCRAMQAIGDAGDAATCATRSTVRRWRCPTPTTSSRCSRTARRSASSTPSTSSIPVAPSSLGTGSPATRPSWPATSRATRCFPGVIQLEALAQAGAIGVLSDERYAGKLPLFGGVEKVRWRRLVAPGRRADAVGDARAAERARRLGQRPGDGG